MPATHSAHNVEPEILANVPATQGIHVPPKVAPLTADAVPTEQLRHRLDTDAPNVVEYVPAMQLVH